MPRALQNSFQLLNPNTIINSPNIHSNLTKPHFGNLVSSSQINQNPDNKNYSVFNKDQIINNYMTRRQSEGVTAQMHPMTFKEEKEQYMIESILKNKYNNLSDGVV